MKAPPKKVISLTQIGEAGYRVESTTNFLDQRVGVTIQRTEVEELMSKGVSVTIKRNK